MSTEIAPSRSGAGPDVGTAVGADVAADGRSTRWDAHRRARREALVDAALRAISRQGAGVGMEEIAAVAGTSKTVLYRHFADKDELYLAVAARVDARVVTALRAAVLTAGDFRTGLREAVATYLHLVEDDPQIYRFVVRHGGVEQQGPAAASPAVSPAGAPAGSDPVAGLSNAVSAELARLMDRHLRAGGVTRAASPVWAHGLVGMVRAAADHWLDTRAEEGSPDADQLADLITALAWGGLGPVIAPVVLPPAAERPRSRPPAPG